MKVNKSLYQFVKFSLVGVLNTLVHYFVFLFLLKIICTNYLVSSGIGYFCGLTNSYFLNRSFTFNVSNKKTMGEATKFLIVNIFALTVNLLAMILFVDKLSLYPELAQILAIGFSCFTNFVGNKFWTFRDVQWLPSRSGDRLSS
jgi:putative flippase GtrA